MVKWLGAGVVTAGVVLACGTGVAVAETDSGSHSTGTTSSQSADKSVDGDDKTAAPDGDTAPGSKLPRNDAQAADEDGTDADTEVDAPDTPTAGDITADESLDNEIEDGGTPVEDEDLTGSQPAIEAPADGSDLAVDKRRGGFERTVEHASVEPSSTAPASRPSDIEMPTGESAPPAASFDPPLALAAVAAVATAATPTPAARITDLPAAQPTAAVTAPPSPTPARSLLEVLGTIVLNLITATVQIFDPPPVTPPPGTARIGRATLTTEQAVADEAVGEQAGPLLPGATNGVTGVQVGHSRLDIPGALIGDSVAADWYFPTQADGSVDAQGVVWLQHGFGATNTFYSALATELAMKTNSIVVAPTLSSIPFTFSGGCLTCAGSQQAASAALLDPNRTALINSAEAAGYTGPTDALKGRFVLAGHSAGGGFATAVASDYINDGTDAQDAELVGVMMFDGVSNGAMDGSFIQQVNVLKAADKPIYQIAAPAQAWNAFGATTNALLSALPGQFAGVVLVGGSHVDSMLGVNPLFDVVLQLVTGRSPAGNTAAVYTLSTGWINDMYVDAGPQAPQYGFYAAANQQIIMGPATALALPSPVLNQLSLGGKVLTTVIDAVGSLFGFSILPTPINTGSNGLDPDQPVVRPVYSNGVTGVRTGNAAPRHPVWTQRVRRTGHVVLPDSGRRHRCGQRRGLAAARLPGLQQVVLGHGAGAGARDQQHRRRAHDLLVRQPAVPRLLPGRRSDARGGGLDVRGLPIRADRQRQRRRLAGSAAGEVHPRRPLRRRKLRHRGRRADHRDGPVRQPARGGDVRRRRAGPVVHGFACGTRRGADSRLPDRRAATDLERLGRGHRVDGGELPGPVQRPADPRRLAHRRHRGRQPLRATGRSSERLRGPSLAAGRQGSGAHAGHRVGQRHLRRNTTYAANSTQPLYGVYGPNGGGPQDYAGGNKDVVMGEATASTLPSPPPVTVDPDLPPNENYLGTWYEQGSVPQFFSIGLVNTKAQYGLNPDGSIRVENSGYYLRPNGLKSTIVGSAVPVNDFNTRLGVGFFFGQPNAAEPGNYWILDFAPDYSWAIVSDPSLFSGYLLTRDQAISDTAYDQLSDRAKQLGVWGPILRTKQYPTGSGAAVPAATL